MPYWLNKDTEGIFRTDGWENIQPSTQNIDSNIQIKQQGQSQSQQREQQ